MDSGLRSLARGPGMTKGGIFQELSHPSGVGASIWDTGSGKGSNQHAPMPTDVYQERASEALRRASASPDMDDRRALRELALCWLRLSDRAEEFRNHADDARFRAA